MLITVDIVRFLQNALNVQNAQDWLNKNGIPFDLMAVIENEFKHAHPDQDSKGIFSYIKNNTVYFLTGDPEKVAASINNYLLLDPKVIDFFGYPITIYSDPSHLRTYALYLIGALIIYKVVMK